MKNKYFEWLYDLVCGKRYSKDLSYRKLLSYLHNREFTYIHPLDINRAKDGIDLRYRFDDEHPEDNGPCSVLEMMVALSIRIEEDYMDNANIGDRSGQWFWGMIVNLGLGSMIDSRFDKDYVEKVVTSFLNREYEPDGHGGLFLIRNCDYDLREVEIWFQMCWYLDSIT